MIKANQNGSSSTFHYGHIINRWADKNEAFLPQTPDPEKPTSIWKLTHKLTNDITKKDEKKINNPRNIHRSLFQFLVHNTPFCTYNDKTVEESWAYRGRRRGTWILYRTWNGVALSPNLDLLVETLRLLLPCKITEETTTKTCTLIRGLCLNEIWWYTNYHLELI